MSSTSAPFGFRPTFHNSGNIRSKVYTIAAAYSTAIFTGDLVTLTLDGVINQAGVTLTDKILGVFQGVEYLDATGKPVISPYWPGAVTGATNIRAYVMDDPETLFDVQMTNSSPGTTVQAKVGEMGVWVATAGSTATGISAATVVASTSFGASSSQIQIVGFNYDQNNALTDTYVIATVRINTHQYKASVAGV